MMMPEYIVKIRSYNQQEEIVSFGTGVLCSNEHVITAKHVVHGNSFKVELVNGEIVIASLVPSQDEYPCVLLKLSHFTQYKPATTFCVDYKIDTNDEWLLQGYVSSQQVQHYMFGKELYEAMPSTTNADIALGEIKIGIRGDYKGLSGSPIVVDGMIIGLAEQQAIVNNTPTSIRIISTKHFARILPCECICENLPAKALRDVMKSYTFSQLEKNIWSKKYIEQIYVEEDEQKEFMRFLCEPKRFLEMSIKKVQRFHFENINSFLCRHGESPIQPFCCEQITDDNLDEIVSEFSKYLNNIYQKLQKSETIADKLISNGYNKYWAETQDIYNTSLNFSVHDILKKVEYASYRYVLITRPAGQGKTNFLCDFTKNFLLKKDYYVLYYNAYDFVNAPYEAIVNKLENIYGKSIDKIWRILRERYQKTLKPFIIVIDGLNENTALPDFQRHIITLLEMLYRYPFIKVIMTARSEYIEERFGDLANGMYKQNFHILNVHNRGNRFRDRIFWGYLDFFGITVRQYSLRRDIFDILSGDMLLLRFFCEAYQGQKQMYMYNIYMYSLFQEYQEKKIDEYKAVFPNIMHLESVYQNLLDKIVVYMLQNKQYHNIPVSILDSNETDLLTHMLRNDVVMKDELNVLHGLIYQTTAAISFTFDEYRDFCIAMHIAKNFTPNQFVLFVSKIRKNHGTIAEGVSKFIFYLSRSIENCPLHSLMKKLPDYEQLYWKNIWYLEDKYLDAEDIENMKSKLYESGPLRKRIVRDLVFRFDLSYFQKLNIQLLFDTLDYLNSNKKEYNDFLHEVFAPYYEDRYKYMAPKPSAVPINQLLKILQITIQDGYHQEHSHWFKLTLYLYELDKWDIASLWIEYLRANQEAALNLLSSYINKVPDYINANIYLLCDSIILDDEVDEKIKQEILIKRDSITTKVKKDSGSKLIIEWPIEGE